MPDAPKLPQLLRSLIETPSISSTQPELDTSNRPVIDQLATWLEDLGFRIRIWPAHETDEKVNLIATLGQGSGGLILAGHTDTVPFDQNRWRHDPFRLTEADDRYYGLGIADMKSFFALAIEALRTFDPNDFRQPLILLATADEETTMAGAQALSATDLQQARHAVIGEPTGLRPVNQHKGTMMESITLIGQSGHSSDPTYGNSALEGMHTLISRLLAFRDTLQRQHHNPAFQVAYPTLNLGHIHGGDNPNRICGECELQLDLRPLPGMALDSLRDQLQQITATTAAELGLDYRFTSLFNGVEALYTPATAPIVRAAEQLTGASTETVAFATEGPFLSKMGIDTLILGPGDIAQAHQPNEYLELARIEPMVTLLRRLIARFCIEPAKPLTKA